MKRLFILLVAIAMVLLFLQNVVRGAEIVPIYLSPRPEATLVQAESTIVFRFEEAVDASSVTDSRLQVTGSLSGRHEGKLFLAKDERTVIFEPVEPFLPTETVTVGLNPSLLAKSGSKLILEDFKFTISQKVDKGNAPAAWLLPSELLVHQPAMDDLRFMDGSESTYVTAPSSFPEITVSVPADGTDDGYIFISNFTIDWRDRGVGLSRPFLLILDNEGEPVFYRAMTPGLPTMDFKKQANGLLTYGEWAGIFYGMDSSYNIVKSYQAGNGYRTDIHDLQILADDHALLMIYDSQRMDMTAYGGEPDAVVVGLVIQELDSDGNVVFQWRSWDHFTFEESAADLTMPNVDYVHGNSVELDYDGNLLISSRAMNEITKIDRQSGEIIWRLGGKANEFAFVDDPEPFFAQHDARRLANGNITVFDNHTGPESTFSRAVEYELDETSNNKTATLVWEHRSSAPSMAMGNAQRLPNGNTMIGWGTQYPSLNEVKPDGEIAFELSFVPPDDPNLMRNSYRAFRFEWEGEPTNKPILVARNDLPGITSLYISWNGATNIGAYRVYGGDSADDLVPLTVEERGGFETEILIADAAEDYCYFRAMPLDSDGQSTRFSNLALAEHCIEGQAFIPMIANVD